MKKFTKVLAALGAVAMLGLGVFTSCGSDDDDDPVLKSIEVTTSPAKTEYTLDATNADGVALEAAGLVINTKWTEGKKDVEVKYDEHAADFSFSPSTVDVATAGTKEITVTYKKKTAKFNVTVKAASENPGGTENKVTAVSAVAGSEEITATGSTVLTATPTKTGEPTITYEWTITEGGDYAEFESASTSETITLKGKSSDATNSHDVKVSVTASDGTNTTEAATVTVKVLKVGDNVTAKVTGVSVAANPTSIEAEGESVLTATPTKSGEPTITYEWKITEGGDYAEFKADSTSETITLKGKNTDTTATHDVTVSVTATDGTNTTEAKTVTVTVGKAAVYFTEFLASELGTSDDNSAYKTFTSKDGLVTMGRSKYQASQELTTADYDEEAGTGYTYKGRVKINKTSGSDIGALTITSVKVGSVLRFDGGNTGDAKDRKMSITGAEEKVWTANGTGSFYLTATASTVVLTSEDSEFSIYGIHVVDEKVATTVLGTGYSDLAVELSVTSCIKDDEVTAKATVTKEEKYSDGKIVTTKNVDVTGDVEWSGAAVTSAGIINTSTPATLSINAKYKYGDGEEDFLTLETPKTLSISAGFTATSKIYAITAGTIEETEYAATDFGLEIVTDATVTAAGEEFVTVAFSEAAENASVPAYIKITSKKATTSAVTVTVKGKDSSNADKTAEIIVEIDAGGAITASVVAYKPVLTYTWDFSSLVSSTTTVSAGTTYKSSPEGLTITTASGAKDIKSKDSTFGLRMKDSSVGITISGLAAKKSFVLNINYAGGSNRTLTVNDTDSAKTQLCQYSNIGSYAAQAEQTLTSTTGSVTFTASSDVYIKTLSITQ